MHEDYTECERVRNLCLYPVHLSALVLVGEDDEQNLCVICLAAEKTHVLVECMHKCVCEGCAERLLTTDEWRGTVHAEGVECPLCRIKSYAIRKVFE